MGDAAGGQPDALLAPDKVWENVPPAVYQILGSRLRTARVAIFARFSPCVGFSEAGQDLPRPREQAAHRGDSALTAVNALRWGILF